MRNLRGSAQVLPLICVLLLVSACSQSGSQARGTAGPQEAPPFSQPTAAASPTPTASSNPTPSVPIAPMFFESIAFGTPKDGWAAGAIGLGSQNAVVVSRSVDGGLSWSAPVTVTMTGDSLVDIRFANASDGWVSGPGLFQTSDGGRTWTDTGLARVIGPVAPAGTSAWALQYPCAQGVQCAPKLIESSIPHGAWVPATHQPPLGPASYQLLRVSAAEAFLMGVPHAGEAASSLVRTLDGGSTWQTLHNPCGNAFGATLASLDGTTVWIVCGGQPSAGNEDKQVYISTNGGMTWSLKASVEIAATSPQGLPIDGYVSVLALTSDSTGFLALSRNGLAAGADEGAVWHVLGPWDGAGGSFHALWFVNADDGWAAAFDGLHQTTDGGASWSLVATWPGSVPR